MKKKLVILCTLVLVIILGVCIGYSTLHGSNKVAFSKEKWNSNIYDRGPMIDDLQQKYDFYSMTKDDIIQLLGENGLDIGENSMRYETGGGYLKDEILSFGFDENGKVKYLGIAN